MSTDNWDTAIVATVMTIREMLPARAAVPLAAAGVGLVAAGYVIAHSTRPADDLAVFLSGFFMAIIAAVGVVEFFINARKVHEKYNRRSGD